MMLLRLTVGICALTFLLKVMAQESPVSTVDICDLAQYPEKFAGEPLQVAGQVSSGWVKHGKPIKRFSISQPFSSIRCIVELSVVLPVPSDPKTDSDLIQDESWEKFEKALRSSMTVAATFQGRFDFSSPNVAAKSKSKKPKKIAGKLILERVSNVESAILYGPD